MTDVAVVEVWESSCPMVSDQPSDSAGEYGWGLLRKLESILPFFLVFGRRWRRTLEAMLVVGMDCEGRRLTFRGALTDRGTDVDISRKGGINPDGILQDVR